MSVKSIIEIDIQDSAFQRYREQFATYQKALADSKVTWVDVTKQIDGSRASFDALVAASAVRLQHSRLIADAEKVAAAQLHRASGETTTQARSWSEMARSTKSFATNIAGATTSLLRWASISGVISGIAGAGGLFGIDRLAQSAASQRKDASGIRVTPGELKSFGLNFGRLLDNPAGFLSGVSESLSDVTKATPYGALGLNYNQERNKAPADVAIDVLRAEKRLADRTPQQQLGNVFSSRQLGMLGQSLQDFQRIKDRPLGELEDYIRHSQADNKGLDLSKGQLKAWEDLKVQLDRAGGQIEKTFVVGLVKLAEPLGHLSDSFVKAVDAFAASPRLKTFIDEAATGLDSFASKIGTPEFGKTIAGFADDIGTLGSSLRADLPGIQTAFGAVAALGNALGAVAGPLINGRPPDPNNPLPNDPPSTAKPSAPPFSWWNPGTWLNHAPGTGPAPRPSPFLGGASPGAYHPTPGDRSFVSPATYRPTMSGALPAANSNRAAEAHDFFRAAGWTEAQTAGLIGNGVIESGLKADAYNPAGGGQGAQGAFQWRGDRIDNFRKMFGHDPRRGTFEEQLMFTQWELTHSEKKAGDRLRALGKTPAAAADIVNRDYERSGTGSEARQRAAEQYGSQFKDRSVTVKIQNQTGGNANVSIAALGAA